MPTRVPMSEDTPERIVDVDVGDEMRGSFLEYAYSVIYARALPDARDGLKPVQRRIIYQAGEMGLRPDRGHVKSARLVGEVMGRLHPHGESAIYDALVRMAQPFSLRLPFIDGHGNFGSLDDGPAAMRYTECRLAPAALPMIEGIHENTVDFVGNYDGREEEPTVLPAAIPSLLVNGATGIAVGMATNIAPHNLVEVINAARHLLTHPSAECRCTDALRSWTRSPHWRQDRRARWNPRGLRHGKGELPYPSHRHLRAGDPAPPGHRHQRTSLQRRGRTGDAANQRFAFSQEDRRDLRHDRPHRW